MDIRGHIIFFSWSEIRAYIKQSKEFAAFKIILPIIPVCTIAHRPGELTPCLDHITLEPTWYNLPRSVIEKKLNQQIGARSAYDNHSIMVIDDNLLERDHQEENKS